MTQDPYSLNNDLRLTAKESPANIVEDDEYDGLDLVEDEVAQPRRKMPYILGAGLVVLLAGGAAAYKIMLPAEEPFPATHKIIEMAAEPPADSGAVGGLPPSVMANDTALEPITPLEPVPSLSANDAIEADPVQMVETDDATLQAVPAMDDNTMAIIDGGTDAVVPPMEISSVDPVESVNPEIASVEAAPEEVPPRETLAEVNVPEQIPVAEPAALPPPPQEQLAPIDPPMASIADAGNMPVPTATQKSAVDTMAAVNEILGGEVKVSPVTTQAMAQQIEITPRASQVIIVKRNYTAQSSQAVVAAGDRVLEARQYAAAVDIFDSELANNPSDPLALAGKALALQKSGQVQAAMDTYERLIDLNPRDLEALTNYLGLLQSQDPQQAIGRLNHLSEQYPSNAAVAGQLGMVYATLTDTPNALRYFQKAASLDTTNPTYPFNLAVLYDRLGTAQLAHNGYMRALKLARDYPSKASAIPVDTIRARLSSLEF